MSVLEQVRALDDDEWEHAARVLRGYFPTGRAEQKPDDSEWDVWAYIAGRGTGKTRAGAEWVVERATSEPHTRWAIVAPTLGDVRSTCFEGKSGVLTVLRRRFGEIDWDARYNSSLFEIKLPNRSVIKGFSAEKPDRLRGPQHHGAWADELAAWDDLDAWDQLQFGLRLGDRPQVMVTTTPRPRPLVVTLRDRARAGDGVVWRSGSTFDNAKWLAPAALEELRRRYEGTRIGRQELHAELLLDTPGALWTAELLDAGRVGSPPDLARVVTAIDPAVTAGEDSDDTGIVVAGLGVDGDVYVLADRTCKLSPDAWARRAVAAHDEFAGDRIVAEVNNGGDLVERVVRTVDPAVPYRAVRASRGKRVRAEPIAALYEQGRVHHVGAFAELEEQLCGWTPESGSSPDRLDALVWAVTDLTENTARRMRFRGAA